MVRSGSEGVYGTLCAVSVFNGALWQWVCLKVSVASECVYGALWQWVCL